MTCELCNANPCQCSDRFQETHKQVDPEVHEHSVIWWISKFSDEIEALQKEIKELKQLAHNPQPVYPPEKGEELEDRVEQLEKKL